MVQSLIAYRNSESEEAQALVAGGINNVRWDLLSDTAKGPTVWAALARKMGPQALRMNLNNLLRHDVFRIAVSLRDADVSLGETDLREMVDYVVNRIAGESEIRRSKQFPYQYFAAYLIADDNVPQKTLHTSFGGRTDCSLPLVAANLKHAKRSFVGIVLVSDSESWVGTGRHGSTGVMTAWEAFVANQRKQGGKEASPKLVNIDLQPYQSVQACERADIENIGGFSDSVFARLSAFLADNNQRFVAEVEAIEM